MHPLQPLQAERIVIGLENAFTLELRKFSPTASLSAWHRICARTALIHKGKLIARKNRLREENPGVELRGR